MKKNCQNLNGHKNETRVEREKEKKLLEQLKIIEIIHIIIA